MAHNHSNATGMTVSCLSLEEMSQSTEMVTLFGADQFSVFIKRDKEPVFILLHGATYTKSTWAGLIKEMANHPFLANVSIMAPDLRMHGQSSSTKFDLSLDQMSEDVEAIYQKYFGKDEEDQSKRPVFIVGHSMGGSLAVHIGTRAKIPNIKAVVTVDSVGEMHHQLRSMESSLASVKDVHFANHEAAISQYIHESHTIGRQMAEVSIVPRLMSTEHGFEFILPLSATRKYWDKWFEHLSEKFLALSTYKFAFIAGHGEEAMSKLTLDLTKAHMQGKFQLELVPGSGHCIQEDNPLEMAEKLNRLLQRMEPIMYL